MRRTPSTFRGALLPETEQTQTDPEQSAANLAQPSVPAQPPPPQQTWLEAALQHAQTWLQRWHELDTP